MKASRQFAAACIHHCRWLPAPPAALPAGDELPVDCSEAPLVLAGWSEDAKQHIVAVVDIRCPAGSHELLPGGAAVNPRLSAQHSGRVTDLQVAAIQDFILAATASSTGGLSLLLMQLPPIPGATTADLVFSAVDDADGSASSALRELPGLHGAPAASVAINVLQQRLLSVAGDGSIAIVRLDELDEGGLSPDRFVFRAASGWASYSQGRWVDSSTFATAGVLGGLQLWDERVGGRPVSRSPVGWGQPGAQQQPGVAQQLLCLDVHPSRPNLAATGGADGSVAVWDLRWQSAPLTHCSSSGKAGSGGSDVWQCKFDTSESLLAAASAPVPPLLFCTSGGALCSATAGAAAGGRSGAGSGGGGSSWGGSAGRQQQQQQLAVQVLQRELYSLNSFDIEPEAGQDLIAATGDEHLLLLHRG